jgi:hypothetical protein
MVNGELPTRSTIDHSPLTIHDKTTIMKLKLICLLVAFTSIHLTASPNRYCNGWRCPGKQKTHAAAKPATLSVMIADDADLLPTQYFLNHI